jgi:nitrogen PTS system EIIA component
MELFDALEAACCSVALKPRTKQQAIADLADLVACSSRCGDLTPEEIARRLTAREQQGSTAYGGGLAIPHARIEGLSEFIVAVGVCPRGVEFEAMDGKRVRLFVVILGPADQPQPYLKLLASISRLLVNARLRRELLHASSAAAAHETCVRWSRITAPAVASKASVLLTVVLYEDQLLHPLLEHFVEMGVEGATILDSQGMNEYISQVPLYAEMIQFMSVRKSRSKTILAIIPDTRLDALIKGIEEITGNLDQVEGAVVYAQELCCVRGTMRMLE